MSYSDFEEFFKIAEKASLADILRDPVSIYSLTNSLEEGVIKSRAKDIVSWLALEQMFISERNEDFEKAMSDYYKSAIDKVSNDIWTIANEEVEELQKTANQCETKRREFEKENELLKHQQEQIKQGLEQTLKNQRADMQKQIDALRAQIVQLERQAVACQAELDRAEEKNKELEKKLRENNSQGQERNPPTKTDDTLLILDFNQYNNDTIVHQINQLSSESRKKIKRILIKGSCTVMPPIYGFRNLIEIEFLSVKVISTNAIRACPSLSKLVFHDKDCVILESFMERNKENRYPLQEIAALPGGNIEVLARNNNIRFRPL